MERWSAIEADDIHLATIRVYANDVNPHTKKPRIILFLPPGPSSDSTIPNDTAEHMSSEPNTYELEMVNDSVENQIVVAERPKDPSLSASATSAALTTNTRARTTILTGRIKHECNLRPMFSASYRKQMRERHLKYNTPTRQIRMIEDAGVPGGRGGVNRLSSGVGVGAGGAFGDLIVRIRSFIGSNTVYPTVVEENKTQTGERHFRAYGSYATQPTTGPDLFAFQRPCAMGHQST